MVVLFTALFGGSDRLKAAPAGPDRCVCFTDDPKLAGSGWEFVRHPREKRPRRAARRVKLVPHEHFPQATASVWCDASIEIRDWPALMADANGADIACLPHPDRANCYDEGRTVIRLRIAHPYKVTKALEQYRADGFAPDALSTTGIFYRRHGARMVAFNELWRAQLALYGTNDQVHVDYCAWKSGLGVKHLRGHYRDNPYAVYDRVDHHARRRPQFLPDEECTDYLA